MEARGDKLKTPTHQDGRIPPLSFFGHASASFPGG